MSIQVFIVGIFLFTVLVITHEYGHFIMAKRNGVEVEEFVVYPPALYKKKMKSGWRFGLGILPIGGYVKLKGEHDSDTEKGSFGAASTLAKAKIMLAGVFINFVTALVLFTILALIGMPQMVPNQYTVKRDTKLVTQRVLITYVESGSPAARAGLRSQDEITNIALPGHSPVAVTSASGLPSITKSFAGKKAIVSYVRDGHEQEAAVSFRSAGEVAASRKTNNPKGYLGVDNPVQYTTQQSTWSAPIVAAGFSVQLTALTFQGLGHALGGLGSLAAGAATGNHVARENGQANASQVGGPVAIVYIMKTGSLLGYKFMLFLIAYIALVLAIMNLLPIPALDGGRLWLLLSSRALKKPLTSKQEERIVGTSFMVLLLIVVIISAVDLHRFFGVL